MMLFEGSFFGRIIQRGDERLFKFQQSIKLNFGFAVCIKSSWLFNFTINYLLAKIIKLSLWLVCQSGGSEKCDCYDNEKLFHGDLLSH